MNSPQTRRGLADRLITISCGVIVAATAACAPGELSRDVKTPQPEVRRSSAATDQSGSLPAWWGNQIGREDIVLPGWSPLDVIGTTVTLGADRSYTWRDSLLPAELSIGDDKVTGPMQLVARTNGEEQFFEVTSVDVIGVSPTRAEVRSRGNIDGQLNVVVTTRIEYDGVATVNIELTPTAPFQLDGLDFVVDVNRTPYMRMLAFDPDTMIRRQKEVLFPMTHKGRFLNVIALPDGNRSFWLFADNAAGWIWNGDAVTEVASNSQTVSLKQRLIGDTWTVDKVMSFDLNFLLTPVKNAEGSWREQRVARLITPEEAKYAKYQIWWITAFAHQNLPYTDYPPGTKARLPQIDLDLYKGPENTRRILRNARKIGIERIPYFSAHALSGLDPALAQFREQWIVNPPKIIPPSSDLPFTAKIARPWASQRAEGFADYLLFRFEKLIDELDLEGLYFDQGGIIATNNPAHGAWTDSNGKVQRSTEILAMRDFYKRLATLFYLKGKAGAVFVHNSKTPIIPAYTFVHSMVQGEEFVFELKNLDYINSISLDMTRSVYAPGQYGVLTTWLSELYSTRVKNGRPPEMHKTDWLNSDRYLTGFRNLMALALLHDTPAFVYAPMPERAKIYDVTDSFGISSSSFVGYWSHALSISRSNDVKASYYRHDHAPKALLVVANLADTVANGSTVSGLKDIFDGRDSALEYRVNGKGNFTPVTGNAIAVDIPTKDFVLIELRSH